MTSEIDQSLARLARVEAALAARHSLDVDDLAALTAALKLLHESAAAFERGLGLRPGWRSRERARRVREKIGEIATTAAAGRARTREIAQLFRRHPNRQDVRDVIRANGGKAPSVATIRRSISHLAGSRTPHGFEPGARSSPTS